MARIPTANALGYADVAAVRPLAKIDSRAFAAQGDAMAGFGNALAGVGAALDAQQGQGDEYEATKKFINFDLEQQKAFDDAQRNVAPDAKDFTTGFRQQYDDSARKLFTEIPDKLKPKFDEMLVRRGAQYERQAYNFQLKTSDDYHAQDVSTQLVDRQSDILANPKSFNDNMARGMALIEASPLSPIAKQELRKTYAAQAAKTYYDGLIQSNEDPETIVQELRGSQQLDTSVNPELRAKPFSGQVGGGNAKQSLNSGPAETGYDAAIKAGIEPQFNKAKELGLSKDNLTTVTTQSGAKFSVSSPAASQFQGFLNELEARGYQINPDTSGGFNDRTIRGTPFQSMHSYGAAIDVNSDKNQFDAKGTNNLPPDVGEIADKWGLSWGGYFKGSKRDAMHFEVSRLLNGKEPSAPVRVAENNAGQLNDASGAPNAKAIKSAISAQLETGTEDPLKGVANISRDSGGSKSYGNFGLNSGGSAQKFVSEYGDALGLQGEPGTAAFDKSWKQVAAADPEGLHQAELDWYSKTITADIPQKLAKAGVPDAIASDPRVQAYFADRSVQQGEASIAKHADRIHMAANDANGDPVEFLKSITEADRGAYRQDFPTAIRSGVYPEEGHNNRLNGRLDLALKVGQDGQETIPSGPPAKDWIQTDLTGPARYLDPKTRTTLIHNAQIAARATVQQDINDSLAEIERTGRAPVDARGRTAIDRATFSLTPNELAKQTIRWQTADTVYKATAPLPNMTTTEARDHIDKLTPDHRLSVESYAIADKAYESAQSTWKAVEDLRDNDPAKSVEKTPEVVQTLHGLAAAGSRLTPVQQNEALITARKAAQDRLGFLPYQKSILTAAEATDLLRIPKHPESSDEIDGAVRDAAVRAKQLYGKYAFDALDSAISVHLLHAGMTNRQEAHQLSSILRQADAPKPPPPHGWWDWMFNSSKPSAPTTQNAPSTGQPAAAPTTAPANTSHASPAPQKSTPAIPAPSSSKAPTPNQNQINWVLADPKNRQTDFDAKFGAGSYARLIASGNQQGNR